MAIHEPKPPIIVHVGLHKTGTTWLQRKIFQVESGKTIIYNDSRPLLRGNFCAPGWSDFSPENFHRESAELYAASIDLGRPLVFSDEALAGFPFRHNKFLREISLTRIKEAIPEAYILITIRAQQEIIQSVYGHYIRGVGTATLNDFLLQPEGDMARLWDPILDLDFYDYSRLRDFCNNLFGKHRTLIIPMEWMIRDTPAFLQLLSERIGLPWEGLAIHETDKVVNPALSPLGYNIMRVANQFYTGYPRWLDRPQLINPNVWGARIDRLIPKAIKIEQKTKQQKSIIEKIQGRYADSNKRLADAIGINLLDYGYEY